MYFLLNWSLLRGHVSFPGCNRKGIFFFLGRKSIGHEIFLRHIPQYVVEDIRIFKVFFSNPWHQENSFLGEKKQTQLPYTGNAFSTFQGARLSAFCGSVQFPPRFWGWSRAMAKWKVDRELGNPQLRQRLPRWWFQIFFIFTPIPGVSWSNLTCAYFSTGWFNHQLVAHCPKNPRVFQESQAPQLEDPPQQLEDPPSNSRIHPATRGSTRLKRTEKTYFFLTFFFKAACTSFLQLDGIFCFNLFFENNFKESRPENERLVHLKIHPFVKENHLPSTSIIVFSAVHFPGWICTKTYVLNRTPGPISIILQLRHWAYCMDQHRSYGSDGGRCGRVFLFFLERLYPPQKVI